ncbi:MAG: AMP-binding protein [Gammaproteobacteria bacterium]|nr:AMP-binding protein [Gammaproteobacteria bacterium]
MAMTSGDRQHGHEPGGFFVDGCDTIPKLFMKKSAERGDAIAMREKDFGIWQSYSWNDYRARAQEIAHGLLSLGLEAGDVAAIQSEDCKEWVFADLGIMLSGGIVNGVYPTYQANQVAYTLADSGCRFLFVEDEEQLDKFLVVEDELPGVEKVIVFDWKGLRGLKHGKVMPIERLYTLGQEHMRGREGLTERIVASGSGDDLALLIYTSGTTGPPKGSMIPQKYLMFQTTIDVDVSLSDKDQILTYLPLCHVAERIFSICLAMKSGAVINFAESPETVARDFQELSPTLVFAVPRVWEKFYSRVTTAMSEATRFGRACYVLGLRLAAPRAAKLLASRDPGVVNQLGYHLADLLVFRNIKELLGLDRARVLYTGAAPVAKGLLEWYLTIGLSITEVYGQTEIGVVTVTRQKPLRQGTVGEPIPGVDLRLADDGEILVRHPYQFYGYLNKPERTAETIVDGWVHTGDVGEIDENRQLKITDRKKDIIITAGGKNVTPSLIENELKFSPYVSDAVVVGDRRKYLTCLVMIDKENVEHHAQTHAIPFTDYRSLCARPEVVELIGREVRKVNERFSTVEQIKKFRLIDVLLTAEDEELTPTMKLKRSFVSNKYNVLIEDMYRG